MKTPMKNTPEKTRIALRRMAGMTAAAAMLFAGAAMADAADSALVKGGRLNLRQEASLTAKVLGQFPTGTLVEVVEDGKDWCKVQVNGKSGYMMTKYLTWDGEDREAKVRTNTGIGLNLRNAPSLSAEIITSFKPGTEVIVMQKGHQWSRVKVNGQEGFMATEYLNFAQEQPSAAQGKVAVVNNPRDTQVLNFRAEPSLDAKVLGQFRNGTKVTIVKSGKDWHKVQTEDGTIGYMMASFLKITNENAAIKPFTMTLVNYNGGSIVNFRNQPSLKGSIIRTVPVGTKVTVIEHGTDWCKVDVDGETGYISTWFMK